MPPSARRSSTPTDASCTFTTERSTAGSYPAATSKARTPRCWKQPCANSLRRPVSPQMPSYRSVTSRSTSTSTQSPPTTPRASRSTGTSTSDSSSAPPLTCANSRPTRSPPPPGVESTPSKRRCGSALPRPCLTPARPPCLGVDPMTALSRGQWPSGPLSTEPGPLQPTRWMTRSSSTTSRSRRSTSHCGMDGKQSSMSDRATQLIPLSRASARAARASLAPSPRR